MRHVFTLIWNRKRRNFLLLAEIFFSFIVLFVVCSAIIAGGIRYLRPRGFDYENAWILHSAPLRLDRELSKAEVREATVRLDRELRSFEEIRQVGWTTPNYPYSRTTITEDPKWEGRSLRTAWFQCDDNLAEVLNLQVIEGRWFTREDDASGREPVVINRRLKEETIGDRPAVGQVYTHDSSQYIVVGVIDNFRYAGEFDEDIDIMFHRCPPTDTLWELGMVGIFSVKSGVGIRFEERLSKHLSAMLPDWDIRIETLKKSRAAYFKNYLFILATLSTVAGFLVFNVALGLFGVLWYSINRRRREIGLRRAVGADTRQIGEQILGESMVLATLGIIAGAFFAVQVPLLGLGEETMRSTMYLLAIPFAAGLIYILVALCALYPSWLASRIQPVEALHYE